jgi:hypothetical protein
MRKKGCLNIQAPINLTIILKNFLEQFDLKRPAYPLFILFGYKKLL